MLINYEYPPLGGGAGNATANIARELTAAGHEVTVLTSAFRGLPRDEAPDGFRIRRIPALRLHADRCSTLEMAVFMVSAAIAAPALAGKWCPDAAIAFFGIPSAPAAWTLKLLRKVPYIVSLRGGDVPGFLPRDLALYHRLASPAIRFLWRRAGAVVANSEGLRKLALTAAPEHKVDMIPNGVDTRIFRPAPDAAGAADGAPLRLLFAGRLTRQKGVDILIEALKGLSPSLPWRLRIAGDGPEKAALHQQAQEAGVLDRVEFAGWLTREDIPGSYRQADVFVLPSRDEGMPNVILEAMASGLPVVATRIAGNDELVRDGETGLLVAAEDAAGLRRAIKRLAADAALRVRMGQAARASAETNYSWTATAKQYAALAASLHG